MQLSNKKCNVKKYATDKEIHSEEKNLHVRVVPTKVQEKELDKVIKKEDLMKTKSVLISPWVKSETDVPSVIQGTIDQVDEVENIDEFPQQPKDSDSADKGDVHESRSSEDKHKSNLEGTFPQYKEQNIVSCEEVIVETMQKHYKCLCLLGVKFTWLGVHMLYRLVLVACGTFITESVTRLYPMCALVLIMAAANAIIKPYKDQRANTTATLSYIANLCIGGFNLVKANYATFGCDTNCEFRVKIIQYMDTVENVLLLYAPLAAILLWVVYRGFQKIFLQCK